MIAKKKRKRGDANVETATIVVAVAKPVERGGRGSGVCIGDQLSQA